MSNFCPYITTSYNYELIKIPCMEDACKFWNAEKGECWLLLAAIEQSKPNTGGGAVEVDFQPVVDHLVIIENKQDTIISILNINNNTMNSIYTDMMYFVRHIHNQHLHTYPHKSLEFTDDTGAKNIAMLPDPTSILLQEFNSGRDIDGNGLVYGMDFVIEDDDTKPIILYALESSDNWSFPRNKIKYEDFLNSLDWPLRYPVEEDN
jgi:hypothetical protein